MADQVEARAGEVADLRRFAFELLHVVLAELAQAQVVGFPDRGCGKDLGHGQQQNAGGIAPRAVGGARDALADVGQSGIEGVHGAQSTSMP